MPRGPRVIVPDQPLHVVQRGINRNTCFFSQFDYQTYLRYLAEFSPAFECAVHAYCLMTNHVHLVLTPSTTKSCALLMKNLGQCYVQTVNHRLGRSGTLWEGRFYSSLITSDAYLLNCYRYVERNPVRAGIVGAPHDYGWSSYRANTGAGTGTFLIPHAVYKSVGIEAYKEMCTEDPPAEMLDEIRKAIRVGKPLGAKRRGRGRPKKEK